jgi:hypothetical protein
MQNNLLALFIVTAKLFDPMGCSSNGQGTQWHHIMVILPFALEPLNHPAVLQLARFS